MNSKWIQSAKQIRKAKSTTFSHTFKEYNHATTEIRTYVFTYANTELEV